MFTANCNIEKMNALENQADILTKYSPQAVLDTMVERNNLTFPAEIECTHADWEDVKDKYWKLDGESNEKESKDQEKEEHQDVEVDDCEFASKSKLLTALLLRRGVE